MRRLIGLFMAFAFVFAAVVSPAALAQENAGEDEYTEGVPGGGGETPSGENGSGSGSPLPPSIAGQFESAGADGAAAAALAEQLDSGAAGPDGSEGGSGNGAGGASPGATPSGSDGVSGSDSTEGGLPAAVGEILSSDSDSGLGIWLPMILGLALLAALVAGIARLRSSRTSA